MKHLETVGIPWDTYQISPGRALVAVRWCWQQCKMTESPLLMRQPSCRAAVRLGHGPWALGRGQRPCPNGLETTKVVSQTNLSLVVKLQHVLICHRIFLIQNYFKETLFGSFTWNTWRGQQLLFILWWFLAKSIQFPRDLSRVRVTDLPPTPLWQVALAAIERNANAAVEPSLWQVMARASFFVSQ